MPFPKSLKNLRKKKKKRPARFQSRICQHRAVALTFCLSGISWSCKLFNAYMRHLIFLSIVPHWPLERSLVQTPAPEKA